MATTVPRVSEDPLVQQHYATQLGLMTALAEATEGLSGPDFNQALAALTQEFQSAAIALSADYYTDLRDEAGVTDAYSPPVLDPWDATQIQAYLDTATADILEEVEREMQALGASQRLTLDRGIDEIFAAMDNEPKQRVRWARVTRPGACSFCLLQATRGAVYRSEESANFRAHVAFNGSGGVCRCSVQVVFGEYEPSAHIREVQALYSEATSDLPRGADRANAFRRALYAQRKTTR